MSAPLSPSPAPFRRVATAALTCLAVLAFLLVFHHFGCPLLPDRAVLLSPDLMHHDPAENGVGYYFDLRIPVLDQPLNPRSRVGFREDGRYYPERSFDPSVVRRAGGRRYAHQPDRIYFATSDNSDPRRNGRAYEVLVPRLYSTGLGRWSLAIFALAAFALALLAPKTPGSSAPAGRPFPRIPVALAAAVFLAGLYANTGTLAPYAISFYPHTDAATGNLYNIDHEHFQRLFAFVDGQPRAAWDGCLFLRRVLFNVLAWPFTKALGYELGGPIAAMALQLAAFAAAVRWTFRRHGAAVATALAWLLALYPGSAYWAGLPYPYALIVPGALLLLIALEEMAARRTWGATMGLSLAMGVIYLGYDLAVFFLPAAALLFAWQRRWRHGAASLAIQVAPLLLWLLALKFAFGQQLENSNSGIYRNVVSAYAAPDIWRQWLDSNQGAIEVAADTFFGANFLFLPALFLAALALNPWTGRTRFTPAEIALAVAAIALFVFNNLAPTQGGWPMRGAWISRLYQPAGVMLLFFLARWLGGWPGLPPVRRGLVAAAAGFAAVGSLLVIFGPALGRADGVAETAYYKFYNHVDAGAQRPYRDVLTQYGRHPLGFTKPARP